MNIGRNLCQDGCIHVVRGHTRLTLAPDQFLLFADMVSAARRQIFEESDVLAAFTRHQGVVM